MASRMFARRGKDFKAGPVSPLLCRPFEICAQSITGGPNLGARPPDGMCCHQSC